MFSSSRFYIPLPTSTVAALALWLLAVMLMVVETFRDGPQIFAAWSLLVAVGAATCTAAAIIAKARSVILDVVSWEARRTRGDDPPHTPDGGLLAFQQRTKRD